MAETENKCPCCGQRTAMSSTVVVSLEENRLRFREHSIQLTSRLAEFACILARRMPATVPHSTIVWQIWGGVEGDFAATNVAVAVSQLRQKLKPLGLAIYNTRGCGYRLAVLPELSQTERKENARASA